MVFNKLIVRLYQWLVCSFQRSQW